LVEALQFRAKSMAIFVPTFRLKDQPRAESFSVLCRLLQKGVQASGKDSEPASSTVGLRTDWQQLLQAAARHCVTPMLLDCLDGGAARHAAPAPVIEYLEQAAAANAARNLCFRDELLRLVRALNAAGIEPLVLKGAARLFDGLYRTPGHRFMLDVDLLVPEARIEEAGGLLRANGYAWMDLGRNTYEPHHLPPLLNQHAGLVVELHHSLGRGCAGMLPADELIARSKVIAIDDARLRIPSREHQIVHLIAHSCVQHQGWLGSPILLRDLVEGALLLQGADPRLHAEVETRFERHRMSRHLRLFLALMERALDVRTSLRKESYGLVAELQSRRVVWQEDAAWFGVFVGFLSTPLSWMASFAALSPSSRARICRRALEPSFYSRRWMEVRRAVRQALR